MVRSFDVPFMAFFSNELAEKISPGLRVSLRLTRMALTFSSDRLSVSIRLSSSRRANTLRFARLFCWT
jgi:hypothetical protein